MRRTLTTVVVCLLIAGLGGVTFGQELVNSTLYGRVTDLSSGKPIASAAIIATSVFGAFTAETNSHGDYRIPFLKPGSYDVRVEASGYSTIIQQDVRLSLGSRTELPFSLAPGKVETLTVTGQTSPVVDRSTTSTGAVITSEMMNSVPIGRNFNNTFYLAPGVNTSTSGGAGEGVGNANPSISGGSGLENNFIVDGINITDSGFGALGAYSRVFGSLGTAVNYDFIKEVQVKTGGFEPEFGQNTGGVINAITKSGGNTVAGDVFAYYTAGDFEGDRRNTPTFDGDTNVLQDGITSGDIGITIGGPFVKDKFFWYVAYNHVETETDRFGASLNEGQLFFDEMNAQTQDFTADNYSLKLTYQINSSHRIELSAFGDPSEVDFTGNRTSALLVQSNDTTAFSALEFGGDNIILRYDGVITPNFLVEVSVAQSTSEFIESFPTINDQPQTRDRRTGTTEFLGGVGFFENTDHESNQLNLKFTNFVGNHEIKYGIQYEDIEFTGNRNRTGDTFTIFHDGSTFAPGTVSTSGPRVDIQCDATGLVGPLAFVDPLCANAGDVSIARISRAQTSVNDVTTTTEYIAPFVQDNWSITPYFNFKFGFRYETQDIGGGGADGQSFTFDDSWAPRLGFTWDIAHNGKSKLYGSLGRFYSKVAQDLALRALSTDASITRADYYWADAVTDVNGDGVINQVDGVIMAIGNPLTVVPDGAGGTTRFIAAGGQATVVDETSENSYADELSLGYEYELRPNLAVGARVIYRELGTILEDIAQNYASELVSGVTTFGTYFITNPDTSTPAYHGPFNTLADQTGAPCSFLDFPGFIVDTGVAANQCFPASTENSFPEPERKYFAMELTIDKRLSNNWQLLASYRYSRSSGNYEGFYRSDNGQTDPNLTSLFDFPDEAIWLFTYENGVLPTDRTHILRFNGSYTFNFGSTLGISWNLLTGAPLTILDAHPAYDNNGELLVEPRGNSSRTPTQNLVDVHFDYPLKTGKTQIKFFLDVFNLFDESQTISYDMDRETNVGVNNQDFLLAISALNPRSVRLGARFSF